MSLAVLHIVGHGEAGLSIGAGESKLIWSLHCLSEIAEATGGSVAFASSESISYVSADSCYTRRRFHEFLLSEGMNVEMAVKISMQNGACALVSFGLKNKLTY